jgi:rSAM/selenodomain-associated transferase 2
MTMNAPYLSIILPVVNEADGINKIVSHIRANDGAGVAEIIVVDGDPLGKTINAIQDTGVITAIAEKGRACQMNRGAALAAGEILLFLHADTFVPAHFLERVATIMRNMRFVAGAFDLGIDSERRIFRITEKYVFLRTRVTRVPFGDQAIFVRKEYFNKIGGYRDIPLMEDIELMTRIKRRGDRIVVIPAKVLTSARRWEREGILFSTFRNWALQLLYVFGVPPEQLVKWYKF